MVDVSMEMIEAGAKAAFFDQNCIMHDHEKLWRKANQHIYRDSARACLTAALDASHVGWPEASRAAADVLAERRRQIEVEGWTAAHDDSLHSQGELAWAAAAYASRSADADYEDHLSDEDAPTMWPWSQQWWKPKDRRRDLVRAGALIVAEIERLDRLPPAPEAGGRT